MGEKHKQGIQERNREISLGTTNRGFAGTEEVPRRDAGLGGTRDELRMLHSMGFENERPERRREREQGRRGRERLVTALRFTATFIIFRAFLWSQLQKGPALMFTRIRSGQGESIWIRFDSTSQELFTSDCRARPSHFRVHVKYCHKYTVVIYNIDYLFLLFFMNSQKKYFFGFLHETFFFNLIPKILIIRQPIYFFFSFLMDRK